MTTDSAALVEAIDDQDMERAKHLLDRLVARAWRDELAGTTGTAVLQELQARRLFHWMLPLADALVTTDPTRAEVRRRAGQALIELGSLAAAEEQLAPALAEELTATERGEALGLLGRISKQRFVHRRSADDLAKAVGYYRAGWANGIEKQWHGVNLVALLAAAERFNKPIVRQSDDDHIAQETLELARADGGNWSVATEAEALLALGDRDGSVEAVKRLGDIDPSLFTLGSFRRQLVEVWALDESDALLLAIDNQLAGRGDLTLPGTGDGRGQTGSSVERFEKIFGAARALAYTNLEAGMMAARSVGMVTDRSDTDVGTAFLLPGSVISERLGPDPILVTNAHVISGRYNGAIEAKDAQVRFEVTRDANGDPLVCDGLTEIWSSPFEECDICLLRFSSGRPQVERWIEPATDLPALINGAYATVIGHPGGGALSISIRGNELIEYDPDKTRMHYQTPTMPGSSGSPVFDSNWRLIGVHHAGHEFMPRLTSSGFHKANEATTLPFIRRRFAQDNR